MAALCSESVLGGIDVGDPASPRDSNRAGAPPDNLSSDKQQSSSSSDGSSTAEAKLKLFAEELAVERHQVETGRVRVDVVTHVHEELVDIPLTREQVVAERVAIDRRVARYQQSAKRETLLSYPVSTNTTPEGRFRNRRIE